MVHTPSDRLKTYWSRPAKAERSEADAADEPASDVTERLAKCIGDHPAMTLAAAAIVGLALGWIVKRK
jgi:hypothetical protein